jgi:N-terminal domain of (some) glycogen debranching enzymes
MTPTVFPPRGATSLHGGAAMLASDGDGFVSSPREGEGLFVDETRFLSRWRWRCEQGRLEPLGGAPIDPDRWMAYFVVGGIMNADANGGTAELILRRTLAADGMTEEATFVHYGERPARFSFSLELDADFQDASSAREAPPRLRGSRRLGWRNRGGGVWEATVDWRPAPSVLRLWSADRTPLPRSTRIRFEAYGCVLRQQRRGIAVEALLVPHAEARVVATIQASAADVEKGRGASGRGARPERTARVDAPGAPILAATVVQAFDEARGEAEGRPVLAPGRGALVAAVQGATLGVAPLASALTGLGRDAKNSCPVDGCDALYAIAVAELWSWTGDLAQIAPFAEVALARLRRMDATEDRDGDGFYECASSGVVGADGRPVEGPIATARAQGYAFLGKVRLAQVMLSLGRADEARRLANQANDLQKRFVHVFWLPAAGYLALGLDRRKRPIGSVTSDAGQCLATGILPLALRRPVADRLLARDLFSGWGIRSLSADHPAYDPYRPGGGAVRVAEQATIALGMGLADLHEHAARVVHGVFDAAALFGCHRLPAAISGHPRDAAHPFPASDPGTAARPFGPSSPVVALVRALLGLAPNARSKRLIVDPHLPAWFPELTLRGLRVGGARVDLRFRRNEGGYTHFEVLDLQGPLDVARRPAASRQVHDGPQPRAV